MKHSQAVQTLERLMIALPKVRSNILETLNAVGRHINSDEETQNQVAKDLYPWLFDEDQNILNAIMVLHQRVATGHEMSPQEFYNIMYLFYTQLSMVRDMLRAWGILLPEPKVNWIVGWEEE